MYDVVIVGGGPAGCAAGKWVKGFHFGSEEPLSYSLPCSLSAWTLVGRPQRLMKPAAWF